MLLDTNALKPGAADLPLFCPNGTAGEGLTPLDATLASILGAKPGQEGANVASEAATHGHAKVLLRDWLFCLAKAPSTQVLRRLIDPAGRPPETLVRVIEDSLQEDDAGGFPPTRLAQDTVEPSVVAMLALAAELARRAAPPRLTDAGLTLALLRTADVPLAELLAAWVTEEKFKKLLQDLEREVGGIAVPPLLDPEGKLNPKAFSPSGRRFCRRLQEDGASLSAKKVTTRHLLYSLLGNEANVLVRSLLIMGVDVKKQMLAVLSRELAHPGKHRTEDFGLTQETMYTAVTTVLDEARKCAAARGATEVGEEDVCRAFAAKQSQEIARFFPPEHAIDIAALRECMGEDQAQEEVDEPPLERFTIREIQERINDTIFGQSPAVGKVIPWVKRLRFGIPRDGRPAGVFLFLGPTGAGKTQMAKELARYVYGNEDMVIFLEMGQFKTKEAMNNFVGAPPGYVGYGEGKLTNGLRDKPECVVLFDEIEKADTQVFDTVLRFADEGMISDPAGPVRDGRKCLIVLTTNAGQTWLRDHLKRDPNARNDEVALSGQLFEAAMEELKEKDFRPEFLGRLDERIVFLPLSLAVCRQIVDRIIDKEAAKFKKLKDVAIEVDDKARNVLANFAFDRSMDEGARGAPRAVNQFIVSPAIDLLSTLAEEDKPLPKCLMARVRGLSDIELAVGS